MNADAKGLLDTAQYETGRAETAWSDGRAGFEREPSL
jgi:hypothetical protein